MHFNGMGSANMGIGWTELLLLLIAVSILVIRGMKIPRLAYAYKDRGWRAQTRVPWPSLAFPLIALIVLIAFAVLARS